MNSSPGLSIVIPTFNNLPVLKQCLERWREFGPARSGEFEVIVIEDGCRDGTPAYLDEISGTAWGRDYLRWFHEDDAHELVCTNRGLAESRQPLVLVWQDDMFVNASWFASELICTFARYEELGLLSLSRGVGYLPSEEPIKCWEDLYDPRRFWSWIGPRPLNWFRLQEVDAVIRPWVVRRKCIDAVGALDESFRPSEWDESDLCYRIRRAGWKIATHGYERTGAYTHLGSTTLRFSDAYKAKVLRNGQLFYSRWDETILREHTRVYRTWWRCGSWASWRWTLRRMANLVFGKLSRSSPVCRKPGKSA